jgi:hypothetical protein
VTFGILTLVTVKVLGFWDVTPCSLVRVKLRVSVKVKVKVKFSQVTCYETHKGEYNCNSTHVQLMCLKGARAERHPGRFTPGERNRYALIGRVGGLGPFLTGSEFLASPGFGVPQRPARTHYAVPATTQAVG